MGSLRRRLIVAPWWLPTGALAEVCDKQRPNWSPADGAVTAVGELSALLASPLGIAATVITLLAIVSRDRWLGIASIGFWLLLTQGQIAPFFWDGVHRGAIDEGCIGPAYLSIGVGAAICIAMFWSLRRRTIKGV